MGQQTATRVRDLDHVHASPTDLAMIATLTASVRPDWPSHLVESVLQSHAHQVHVADLACAAMRAAQNPDLRTPKAIGWRGPHWDGAKTTPLHHEPRERCNVCGKTEPRCVTERPGRDDDHEFEPVPR